MEYTGRNMWDIAIEWKGTEEKENEKHLIYTPNYSLTLPTINEILEKNRLALMSK